jgi:phage gp36-like protein
MAYATWSDAKIHLDQSGLTKASDGNNLDLDVLQAAIEDEENKLNAELKRFVAVPVDKANSPQMFDYCRQIVAYRAAAYYIRKVFAPQKDEAGTWWADRLDGLAKELVNLLTVGKSAPDDAVASDRAYVFTPSITGVGTTDADNHEAIFRRRDINKGTGTPESGRGRW